MRHLSDERLIDTCFNHSAGVLDQQHLDGCPSCEQRRTDIVRLLADVSAAATAEADTVFTDERLARQRAYILQRIEREGRSARLVTFPSARLADRSPGSRPGMRWIAGAAAAGLMIGLLAGQRVHVLPNRMAAPNTIVGRPIEPTLQAVSTTMSEDEFLGWLEIAVEGTSGSALQPLDELTPRVWEVAAQ